jgi:long-chain-fatty-acid--CoA ligase ACSBG
MIVFKKIREALGLEYCNGCYTAAAPISIETLNYFASLNIPGLSYNNC